MHPQETIARTVQMERASGIEPTTVSSATASFSDVLSDTNGADQMDDLSGPFQAALHEAFVTVTMPKLTNGAGALMLEQTDDWSFPGLRRASGATVLCTPPLHAGGKSDRHLQ